MSHLKDLSKSSPPCSGKEKENGQFRDYGTLHLLKWKERLKNAQGDSVAFLTGCSPVPSETKSRP